MLMYLYQLADSISFLILGSIGLAIIFGMMGVINLAHGELIAVGAYATVVAAHAGAPLVLAMALAAVVTGLLGAAIEIAVVRRLYGRPFDSIVATWGIGLIISQGILIVAGPSMEGIGTPLGSIMFGDQTVSVYRLVLIAVALVLLCSVFAVFSLTRFGVHVRAAMQDPDMARALGLNVRRIYTWTFACGAALAGLAGGLYAPTMTIVPTVGAGFVVPSFVTVVVGGGDVLTGLAAAAAVLALVQSGLTISYGTLIGQVGLLIAVMVVVRLQPKGLSEWIRRS